MPALTHSHLPGDLHDRLQQLLDSARFGSPSETDGGLQQTAQPSGRTAGRQQTRRLNREPPRRVRHSLVRRQSGQALKRAPRRAEMW